MNNKFSIILPTFNRDYILWKALLSIINQKYSFWELIIIDDGSSDNTCKMVKEFSEPRFSYYYIENAGVCNARNFGLKKAKGDYICYLDSDNEFRDDYLFYLNQHLIKNKSVKFGICNQNVRWELYDDNYNLIDFAEESSSYGDNVIIEDISARNKRFDTNGMFHASMEIKWREEVKYMHDWELLLQLVNMYPNDFLYIPLSLVKYYSRYNRDGLCANVKNKDWMKDYENIWKIHCDSKYRPSDDWFKKKIDKYKCFSKNDSGQDVRLRIERIFNRKI